MLTNTDANGLYEALCYQIIESYLNLPYRNLSEIYYGFYAPGFEERKQQMQNWEKITGKNPSPALDLSAYTGTYQNPVYGNITITKADKGLSISFEHHSHLKGVLKPAGNNLFICYYDPISWGVKEIPFVVEDGKVKSVTITINDFIDFLPYEFTKL